ncbi:MAG: hypothetical protein K1X81_02675 [Bacteroidia bacterium]|nr:hypothetical protein [Bacteroidia bacterium]
MKLKTSSRLIVLLCALSMSVAYFSSVWKIELEAPQYPEGLKMEIWVNDIKGDISSINNLNHYIGMSTIHVEDFPEFKILPVLLAIMIAWGILAAALNTRKALFSWVLFLILVAAVASVDFWLWEYKYGHNLDPHAAIKIPGMSYQPPLIGYKELLNFLAGSLPDTGGYFIIVPAVISAGVLWMEHFIFSKKT